MTFLMVDPSELGSKRGVSLWQRFVALRMVETTVSRSMHKAASCAYLFAVRLALGVGLVACAVESDPSDLSDGANTNVDDASEEDIGTTSSELMIKRPPMGTGCQNVPSGHSFECNCETGQSDMMDDTVVFNQCSFGKSKGAKNGRDRVVLKPGAMGMAVYSPRRGLVCGGLERECTCTCFDQAAVDGDVAFRTFESTSSDAQGAETLCLGLCGRDCLKGKNGERYASILVHDVCQSYIGSSKPFPAFNDCDDEATHAASALAASLLTSGGCPK